MPELTSLPETWRTRLGRRSQVGALALVLLTVALVAGNAVQGQVYGPQGAVKAYFAALESGNVSRATSLIDIGGATTKSDSVFLSRAALVAAMRSEKQTFPGLRVDAPIAVQPDLAVVPVNYAGAPFSVDVKRESGFFLGSYTAPWRLLSPPVQLTLTPPAGTSHTTVDGQTIATGSRSTAALLPLKHLLAYSGGPLVEPQTTEVDLTIGRSATAPLLVPKLSPLGIQKATEAITVALTKCAAATGRAPADCPQVGPAAFDSVQPTWQQIGNPTVDLAFGTDDQGRLVGTGHFQMVMTSGADPTAANHLAMGGAYSAVLAIGSSDIQVQTISQGPRVAPAVRPAGATDDAARQLVSAAFAKCGAATVIAPPDCPQADLYQSVGGRLENVQWHLSGDPLANARSAFDGAESVFRVTGPFAMSVDYDFVDIGRIHHTERSTNTKFEADLFWDGTALKLVSITGGY